MRKLFLLVPLLVCVEGWSAVVGQDTAEIPPAMAKYIVGLIFRGPSWSPEVTQEVMEVQAAHLANINRLVDSGKIVLAGPFGDGGDIRGLFIYNVETLEAAQTLVDSDPAVQAGRLRVELYPWWGPSSLVTLLRQEETDSPKKKVAN